MPCIAGHGLPTLGQSLMDFELSHYRIIMKTKGRFQRKRPGIKRLRVFSRLPAPANDQLNWAIPTSTLKVLTPALGSLIPALEIWRMRT